MDNVFHPFPQLIFVLHSFFTTGREFVVAAEATLKQSTRQCKREMSAGPAGDRGRAGSSWRFSRVNHRGIHARDCRVRDPGVAASSASPPHMKGLSCPPAVAAKRSSTAVATRDPAECAEYPRAMRFEVAGLGPHLLLGRSRQSSGFGSWRLHFCCGFSFYSPTLSGACLSSSRSFRSQENRRAALRYCRLFQANIFHPQAPRD